MEIIVSMEMTLHFALKKREKCQALSGVNIASPETSDSSLWPHFLCWFLASCRMSSSFFAYTKLSPTTALLGQFATTRTVSSLLSPGDKKEHLILQRTQQAGELKTNKNKLLVAYISKDSTHSTFVTFLKISNKVCHLTVGGMTWMCVWCQLIQYE